MPLSGLRRVGTIFGSASCLALGCAEDTGGGGAGTGSTGTSDTGTNGSGTGSSDTDGSGTGSSGTGSSSDTGSSGGTSDTGTTEPPGPCVPIQLADVALGIGGFCTDGEAEQDWSAWSVSGAGDVNDDGRADIIVGAPQADPNGADSGRAYVVFGKADTDPLLLADVAQGIGGFALDGEAENDHAGVWVRNAGDVNDDGLPDLIVGAWGADPNGESSGRAYVVFGKADTTNVSLAQVASGVGGFALNGESAGDFAGAAVSTAGDANDDGLPDLIVGAYMASAQGPASGRSYLVHGKTSTAAVSLATIAGGTGGFAIDGASQDDHSGRSVSDAGDVNGDGLPDVIVGAPAAHPNGFYSGSAYVVFGKTDTDNVSLSEVAQGNGGFVIEGEAVQDAAGFSVSGAGDVNGDGLDDVIVGSRNADPNGIQSGRSYVVFGKADTDAVALSDVVAGTGGFALDGEGEYDYSARAVTGSADINGDGLDDVIIGAYRADPNQTVWSGRTYVVFGKTDTDHVQLADIAAGHGGFAIDGEMAGDRSGHALGVTGDMNGDGLDEIVIGAYWSDFTGLCSGRTYVVFGHSCTDPGG